MPTVVHEEVIRVGFDTTSARAELESLTKAAERLRGLLGGGSDGAGVPVAGAPTATASSGAMPGVHVGGGSGGGGGVSPTGTPVAPNGAPMPVSSAQATAPAAAPSATVSSTSASGGRTLPERDPITGRFVKSGEGGTVSSGGIGGFGFGFNSRIISGMGGAFASGVLSGDPMRGALGGLGGLGGLIGGPAGAAVGVVSDILTGLYSGGRDFLMDAGSSRAELERRFGFAQLGGFGGNGRTSIAGALRSKGAAGTTAAGLATGMLGGAIANAQGIGVDGYTNFILNATGRGFMPDEAVSAAEGFARGRGGMGRFGARGTPDMLGLMLSGVDAGTTGAIERLRFLGGATGGAGTVSALAGLGQKGFGVSGDLDAWLRGFTSQMDRLVERGLRIDLDSVTGFMGRMARDPTLSRLGMQAPGLVGGLMQIPGRAADSLLGGMGNIVEQMVLAQGFRGAGSFLEGLQRTERIGADPKEVLKSLSGLSPEVRAMALRAAGLPGVDVEMARALSGLDLSGPDPSAMSPGQISERSQRLRKVRAAREGRRVTTQAPTAEEYASMIANKEWADVLGSTVAKSAEQMIVALKDVTQAMKGNTEAQNKMNGAFNEVKGSIIQFFSRGTAIPDQTPNRPK